MRNYFRSKLGKVRLLIYLGGKLPIIKWSLGAILGAICFIFPQSLPALAIGALIIWRKQSLLILITLITSFSVLQLNYGTAFFARLQELVNREEVHCVVISDSQLENFNQRFECLERSNNIGILLSAPKYPVYEAGDILRVKVRLEIPTDSPEFAERAYLFGQGIFLKGDANDAIVTAHENNIYSFAALIREDLKKQFYGALSYDQAALLTGLVTGSKERFSGDFQDDLRKTGTSHIIAVSGSNIAMLLTSLLYFSAYIGRNRLIVCSIVVLIVYNFVVGLNNLPALRAVVMGIVTISSWLIGKPYTVLVTFMTAIALMLNVNPFILLSVSFQLSVSAFLAIILLVPALQSAFSKLGAGADNFVTSLAATLGTLPVSASTFGGVSLVGVLANLFVLPIIPFALTFGLVAYFTKMISLPLGQTIYYIAAGLLELSIETIRVFAQIPFGYSSNSGIILAFFILLVTIYLYADFKKFRQTFTK